MLKSVHESSSCLMVPWSVSALFGEIVIQSFQFNDNLIFRIPKLKYNVTIICELGWFDKIQVVEQLLVNLSRKIWTV